MTINSSSTWLRLNSISFERLRNWFDSLDSYKFSHVLFHIIVSITNENYQIKTRFYYNKTQERTNNNQLIKVKNILETTCRSKLSPLNLWIKIEIRGRRWWWWSQTIIKNNLKTSKMWTTGVGTSITLIVFPSSHL